MKVSAVKKPLDAQIDTSQEDNLQIYLRLLEKWQPKINLVSGQQDVNSYWERHFVDSAQLAALVNTNDKTCVDLGSGGGFPGLVLAITTDLHVTLIESDQRKCSFLRTVSRETNANTEVVNSRIEGVEPMQSCPDIITARALAPLLELLNYCFILFPAMSKAHTRLLFLKGAQWESEIKDAQKHYKFEFKKHQSVTHNEAQVLEISSVRPI
tara:strand:+ start:163633 stop:164265 length:633 start_codon:yes stop_codon:yes gene_type:complete